jgi:hypothetical protein
MEHTFILKSAYLSYFFTEINQLNFSLQGHMMNILTAQDTVKFPLCQRSVEADDISMW